MIELGQLGNCADVAFNGPVGVAAELEVVHHALPELCKWDPLGRRD
jgi:hypothetical protein